MGAGGRYKLRIHGVGRAGTSTVFPQAVFALCDSTKTLRCLVPASRAERFKNEKNRKKTMKIRRGPKMQYILLFFGQHRTIPALRLKHRSGSLFPPLAALTFAASSIICVFGLAAAAPRSPYRHLELCGIALAFEQCIYFSACFSSYKKFSASMGVRVSISRLFSLSTTSLGTAGLL